MEVPTPQPVEKNVFKRLFKADAKTRTPKTPNEDAKKALNKTLPSKGRLVSSKFNGISLTSAKPEGPKTLTKKPLLMRTPAHSTQSKAALKTSLRIKIDKTPPSVRLAKNKLQSARYWLSLVDVAEKAGKHAVAMGLLKLAIDTGAQPISDVEKCQATYKKRYQLAQAVPATKETACQTQTDIQTQTDQTDLQTQTDIQSVSTPTIQREADRAEDSSSSEICQRQQVQASVKNLFPEEYSQVPVSDKDGEIENHQDHVDNMEASSSEVVNSDVIDRDLKPEEVKSKEPEVKLKENTTPPPPRRTPRRACAIRAAIKLEESAKKQTRRKGTGVSVPEVENMDVNTLMKEVVSGVLGHIVENAEQEIFSRPTVLGSGSKNKPKQFKEAVAPKVPARGRKISASPKPQEHSMKTGNEFEVVNEMIKSDKEKPAGIMTRGGRKNAQADTNKKDTSGKENAVRASNKDPRTNANANEKQQPDSETPPTRKQNSGRDNVKQVATPGTVEPRRSARLLKSTSHVN